MLEWPSFNDRRAVAQTAEVGAPSGLLDGPSSRRRLRSAHPPACSTARSAKRESVMDRPA